MERVQPGLGGGSTISDRARVEAAYPVLARLLPGDDHGSIREALAHPRRPRGPSRGHVRRMQGVDWGSLGPESSRRLFGMLQDLPSNWIPADRAGAEAARDLEPIHEGMRRLLGITENPFPGCRGRWAGYRDALCRETGVPPAALGRLADRLARVARDVARAVVAPLLAPGADPEAAATHYQTAVAHALWSGRDFRANVAEAAAWERLAPGLEPDAAWPVPATGGPDAAGLSVVPLGSSAELAAEARAMRNCLSDYAVRCGAGESVILAIRHGRTTVSVAEIGPGGDLREHRGPRNGPAPEAARLRLEAYLAAPRPSGRPRAAPTAGLGAEAGLPPRLRGLGEEGWRRLVRAAGRRVYGDEAAWDPAEPDAKAILPEGRDPDGEMDADDGAHALSGGLRGL